MKTKMAKGIIVVLFIASMLIAVNAIPSQADSDSSSKLTVDLIAGGGGPEAKSAMDVGDVFVWNDGCSLYVKYCTACTGWLLNETHLAVATDPNYIPQTKKGNPIPGHFPYQTEHDPEVNCYIYEIPLVWDCGTVLYIAAHADVHKPCTWYETAWADGGVCHPSLDFSGNNWATYFMYKVQCC